MIIEKAIAGVFVCSLQTCSFESNIISSKSTPESETYSGGYFGAGFSHSQNVVSGTSYSKVSASPCRPLLPAGVRIGSAKESFKGHTITVGSIARKSLKLQNTTPLVAMCRLICK